MAVQYKDYYKILGVDRKASQEEVNKAYRQIARKLHPDVNKEKGAEDKLKEINEAYEVLKDAQKRQRYDLLGANWNAGQNFQPPPGWGGPGQTRPGGGRRGPTVQDFSGFGGGGFSDFFESLFGGAAQGGFDPFGQGRAQGAHPSPPGRQEGEIEITLEDAYRGAQKNIAIEERGAGGRPQRKTLQVKIPAGIAHGGKIRLAGQGQPGPRGAGDLILSVKIAPHPVFKVNGHDLEADVSVTPWEAALGGKIPAPTLDGPVIITLPPGAQSGAKMRLRGKGLPKRAGEPAGDLYVNIQIAVPKSLSPKERELFEELARHSPFNPRK